MKKAISLFLVLSVLCSCALVHTVFAEGTTLPNNVQWGMSVQTIREITGETEHPGYYNDAETVLQLPVAGQRVSKYTATQLYVLTVETTIERR